MAKLREVIEIGKDNSRKLARVSPVPVTPCLDSGKFEEK